MRCPYCTSEISDQALACPHCARDLYLFKPLLQGIETLEARVADYRKTIAALEARLAALEKIGPAAAPTATRSDEASAGETPGFTVSTQAPSGMPANPLGALIPCVVVPIALLLLTHWVMLFIYDVKPLYLRLATLVLPIPFGLVLASHYGVRVGMAGLYAAMVGVLAVAGMLAVTATIDSVPFLPQGARDWRETIEYVAGIGLAAFTGWLLANAFLAASRWRHREPPRVVILVAKAFKTNEKGEMAVEQLAKRIQKLINTATPAVSGAAAFYAGLKGVLGDV